MSKFGVMAMLLIGTSLLCTSCWDRTELREVALCIAMSIEKTPSHQYLVSFQIINPGSIIQGQQSGAGGSSSVTIYNSTGMTIEEAARKATQQMSRRMLFSHMSIIVIDNAVAKEGLRSLLDIFQRDNEIRMQTNVVIARDSPASKLLSLATAMESIPAIQMAKQMLVTEQLWGETHHIQIDEVIRELASNGKQLTIGGIGIGGNDEKLDKSNNTDDTKPASTLQAKGIAIFNKDRLVGWLDHASAQGYLWTQKMMRRTALRVACNDQNDRLTIDITRNKSVLQTVKVRNQYVLKIHVRAAGSVKEVGGCTNKTLQNLTLMDLEQKTSKRIKEEIESTLKIAQKYKVDIFGFGTSLDRADRKEWKYIMNNWNDLFSTAKVDIKVDMSIINTGMTTNHTQIK